MTDPQTEREKIRSRLRAKPGSAMGKREPVTITLDGEAVAVEVRRIPAGVKLTIQDECFREVLDPEGRVVLTKEGNPETKPIMAKFVPALIEAATVVPGTDVRVWEDGEYLAEVEDDAVQAALFGPAVRMAGWGKKVQEEIRGNSDSPPVADASSGT